LTVIRYCYSNGDESRKIASGSVRLIDYQIRH
jgi:hypothetical protein